MRTMANKITVTLPDGTADRAWAIGRTLGIRDITPTALVRELMLRGIEATEGGFVFGQGKKSGEGSGRRKARAS